MWKCTIVALWLRGDNRPYPDRPLRIVSRHLANALA
jgi:hypothetical protein